MNAAPIKKIIRFRFHRLKKYLRQMKRRLSREAIHHFRVEVKKLRAFLRMISGDKLKIPHALKNIYRQAGSVRELQLFLQQTNKEKTWGEAFQSRIKELRKQLVIERIEL